MTDEQLVRAELTATSRDIDLETAQELIYLRDRVISMVNINEIISVEFAQMLTEKLGYRFEPDRIQRIDEEARFAISEGLSPQQAYSHAVNLEIAMYGDPHSKCVPVGILNVT